MVLNAFEVAASISSRPTPWLWISYWRRDFLRAGSYWKSTGSGAFLPAACAP